MAGSRGFNSGMLGEKFKDGTDTNLLHREAVELAVIESAAKDALSSIISTKVNKPRESIAAQANAAPYEEATPYGEPVAHRATLDYLTVGYTFSFRDSAWRMTWQDVQNQTADEARALISAQIIGDRNGVHRSLLGGCYNPAQRRNREGDAVFGFLNGDGTVHPSHNGQDFTPAETHYLTTGTSTYDGDDATRQVDKLTGKGYGPLFGYQILMVLNPADSGRVRSFRAGSDPVGGNFDFIPGVGGPARFEATPVIGQRAPADYNGLSVIGSYGPALVVESEYAPRGYVLAIAVSGPNSFRNPVALRESENPNLRGLQIIPGNTAAYPIVDSFFVHGFGSGVRYRGAGCVMQITENAAYTPPAEYANGTF